MYIFTYVLRYVYLLINSAEVLLQQTTPKQEKVIIRAP